MAGDLRRCAAALAPDNIEPRPPIVADHGWVATALANPVPGIAGRDEGLCLGRVFGAPGEWWRPGAGAPDGNYVIVRHDERVLELLTDVLGTRQLWYIHAPDLFAASTSQRALVMLLRSFELDPEAVAWMLTSGHLAGRAWDARVRRLRGDCRLSLDRDSWRIQIHERPAVREPQALAEAEHIDLLREAILETCAALDLPEQEWVLPLSGGLDSRMLLLGLLEAGKRPRCVTWGQRSSLLDPTNDAFIATELARRYALDHTYRATDDVREGLDVALRRFVSGSEGQTRDFGGYADGMAMWKAFFDEGVAGVIRGDEPAMGYWEHYDSESEILRRRRITLAGEYPDGHAVRRLGLVPQHVDERLQRHGGETLASWDARIYEEVFYPSALAPLNALKTAYVEIVNPLQSRRVTEVTRRLPDHLRVKRKPLRTIVAKLGPDLPLAKTGALAGAPALWRDAAAVAAISTALNADTAERVLDRPALDLILAAIARKPAGQAHGRRAAGLAKKVLPRRLSNRLRPLSPPRLGGRELAFRTYIAVEMADLLSRDAGLLARGRAR